MRRPQALEPAIAAEALPPGAVLALDPSAFWLDARRLAGGSPFRIVALSEAGAGLVRRWVEGEALGDGAGGRRLARRLVDAGLLQPRWRATITARQVTVVIPVRDRPEQLAALLPRLSGLEVLVVDDGSADADAIARAASAGGAALIRRAASGGPSAARNAGLAAVATSLTCFMDSDCLPEPGFLDGLLGAFTDPTVAAVAPRIVGGPARSLLGRFEESASPLDVGRSPARVRPGSSTTFVPSACLIVRTALGPSLFDEELRAGEDVDLVWRLAGAGWSVRLEPSVEVAHPARPSLRSWLAQRALYGRSATALAERHGDAVAPIGGSAATVAAWLAFGLGLPLLSAAALGAGIARVASELDGAVDEPVSTAAALVLRSSLDAGPTLSRQVVRSYAPVLLIGSVLSCRVRRATILAAALGQLSRWWRSGSELDPLRFCAVGLLDDLAYCAGLWQGALGARRAGALKPRLVWFGRSPRGAEGIS